jgi:hypothetical protein
MTSAATDTDPVLVAEVNLKAVLQAWASHHQVPEVSWLYELATRRKGKEAFDRISEGVATLEEVKPLVSRYPAQMAIYDGLMSECVPRTISHLNWAN